MSMSNLATAPTLPLLGIESVRHIEIVTDRAQRRARPKVAYAVVVVASLGVLMLAQLALSIALSDGAYTIDGLQATQKEQARAEQLISEDLGRLSSPQNLATNAEALGMVQNANPVWLRMSDGAVIGTPTAAAGGEGVLGSAGSKVANELLAGVPLVTQQAVADQANAQAAADAAAASTAAATAAGTAATSTATTQASGPVSATPTQDAQVSTAPPLPSDSRVPAPTTR
jgi:hypothetical protein